MDVASQVQLHSIKGCYQGGVQVITLVFMALIFVVAVFKALFRHF